YGFACADSFANYMGADYDSNGDGQIDSDALKYVQGESEDAYVNRLVTTLRSTIRDANVHLASPGVSYDYIQSDNTHPTYDGGTHPVRGHLGRQFGLRTAGLHPEPVRQREEPGVEPVRARAHGLGPLDVRPAHAVTAHQGAKRSASSAGTPA